MRAFGFVQRLRWRLLAGFVSAGALAFAAAGGASGAAAVASATGAAVQVVPFATGHIVAAGRMAQPPTTAECESDFGIACYQAFQLQRAYDLAPLFARGIDGQGETIVIVDAFGSPSISSDLQTFDAEMGLPNPPSFQVITPEGPITTNPTNCTSVYSPVGPDECSDYLGWTDETSLDVEWSHAMAPGANILLVETPMTETEGIYGLPQIVAAENYVIDHHLGNVITQSFGANEQTFSSPSPDLPAALGVRQRGAARGHRPGGERRPGLDRLLLRPELGLRGPGQRALLFLDQGRRLALDGSAGHGCGRHPVAPQRCGLPDRPR